MSECRVSRTRRVMAAIFLLGYLSALPLAAAAVYFLAGGHPGDAAVTLGVAFLLVTVLPEWWASRMRPRGDWRSR